MSRELCTENLDEEPTLQKELTWGLSYRNRRQADRTQSITQKKSPINMPFQLCRALLLMKKLTKKKKERRRKSDSYKKAPKLSLTERSALPQSKYMELLAIPNRRPEKKDAKKKKVCCKCKYSLLCRPRIIQMAIPNKRYVWENWKTYQHVLPAEVLMRFDQILKSGDNLEPEIARCYFKSLQRKKRRELRRKRRLRRKKKEKKKMGAWLWLEKQLIETADAIVDYIRNSPLLVLNFEQMMTSNELLRFFTVKKVIKVKKRSTKSVYKKSLIEISDKLVKWIDGITFRTEIQPLTSKEQLGVLEIPSMESLLEEEIEEIEEEEEIGAMEGERGEGFGEGEGEERRGRLLDEFGEEVMAGEEEVTSAGFAVAGGTEEEQFEAKKIVDKARTFDQYEEEEGSFMDMLHGLDEDILEKLIQILSESPEDFLGMEIDPENLPGVTYGDVLAKLKEIRDGKLLETQRPVLPLEEKLVEWAKTNEPDQVDDKVLDKIHETAAILGEFFKNVGLEKGLAGLTPGAHEEGEGEGEGGAEIAGQGLEEGEEEGTPEGGAEGGAEGGTEEPTGGAEGATEGAEGAEGAGVGGTGQEEAPGEGEGGEEGEGAEDEEAEGEGAAGEGAEGEGAEGEGAEGAGAEGAAEEAEEGVEWEEGALEGEEAPWGEAAKVPGYDEDLEWGEEAGVYLEEGEEYAEFIAAGAEEEELLGEEEGEVIGKIAEELEKIDSFLRIIRGHKPSKVFEHTPGTICCLSLKIWAVWLLEIANNAHNWTKWIGDIIRQVRHYAAIIRGDVKTPSGHQKLLYKGEWRKFVADTEEKVIAWRHYSKHVKDLSSEIMENFHGKPVNCCPKCLQDHLIKNVVTAHETFQALTEAINCADYWQRCLDKIVEQTSKFADIDLEEEGAVKSEVGSEESLYSVIEIEELSHYPARKASEASGESILEIEEIAIPGHSGPDFELLELDPKPRPHVFEVEPLQEPEEDEKPTKPKSNKSLTKAKGGKAAKGKKKR